MVFKNATDLLRFPEDRLSIGTGFAVLLGHVITVIGDALKLAPPMPDAGCTGSGEGDPLKPTPGGPALELC